MKKVILALAVVSVTFAACNNGDSGKPATTDSTKMTTGVDSTKKVDTATKAMVDTTKKAVVDTAKKAK